MLNDVINTHACAGQALHLKQLKEVTCAVHDYLRERAHAVAYQSQQQVFQRHLGAAQLSSEHVLRDADSAHSTIT